MAAKNTQKLAKFLSYSIGRRPDEFGLVPDGQGYFKIKELLKAINTEAGWRHIRLAHLNEVALTVAPSPIEMIDHRIRAADRSQLPQIRQAERLPKLLYIAVRNRAYPVVYEKGLHAGEQGYLVLAADSEMAMRIGRRRDQNPVLLTVQVARSMDYGSLYETYGEGLFLANTIAPGTFSGPPLPKEKPGLQPSKKMPEPSQPKMPGSYFPDVSRSDESAKPRRKEVDWKKDRRLARKHKYRKQG